MPGVMSQKVQCHYLLTASVDCFRPVVEFDNMAIVMVAVVLPVARSYPYLSSVPFNHLVLDGKLASLEEF